VGGLYAGRRGSIDTYSDLVLTFEKERTATAILRDQVDELLERITQERKRVVGERTRMEAPPKSNSAEESMAGLSREAQLDAVRQRYEA